MKNTDLGSSDNVEDLGRAVASSGNIFSIVTESNTAHYTLMLKSMDEINIEHTGHFWIEDRKPILLYLFLRRRQTLEVQFC